MPLSHKTSTGAAPLILLVEEYPALAAAFSALLRKFAPHHQVRVATTLGEAETAVRECPPELIIADFDPVQRDAVGFFRRLKSAAPELRALIIAADDPREITREPNGPSALHFIKKPFEVNAFGALIATLTSAESSAPALRDMSLADLLVLHAVAAATTVLQIEGPDGRSGEIHFSGGRIAHALVVGLTGVAALHEILRWRAPQVRETERRIDAPHTIQGGWISVLLEAFRATRALPAHLPEEIPPAPAPISLPPPEAKKILLIDDTEMLLIFVDEVLSTANPAQRIVTAATGLDGVEKAIAEQPDLILLDYSLPDITGDEVCRRLLAQESTAQLPIIMMSGHVPEMVRTAAEYENVVATIAKPFLSTALLDLVQRTLADLPRPLPPSRRKAKPKSAAARPDTAKSNGRRSRQELQPAAGGGAASSIAVETAAQPEPPPQPAAPEPTPPSSIIQMPPQAPPPLAPAALQAGKGNAVVLTLPLEVVSIQFSPELQMRAIRARPFAPTVSLHILPQSLPGSVIPEAGFELSSVDLDARGQIDTVRLVPTTTQPAALAGESEVPVAGIALSPVAGERAMELIPAATAPMRMQLTALFELAGVELSSGFRVSHLVLKWRGGKMRVSLQADAPQSGVTFETAQVLLDRSSKIAEVLLDAVA